jgi:hypothetical protein
MNPPPGRFPTSATLNPMRRLSALILMILLAVGAWFGARWLAHRGEVKATIVFDDASPLRPGDPVLDNQVVIGHVVRVDRVDDRDAVTIRLSRDHRRSVVTDSLFSIDGHALDVSNTFAVGRPIDNGTILYAREDRISRWLAKHGKSVKPLLDKARAKADALIDDDFSSWTAKVPEWKNEGADALQKHLDDAKKRVDKAEADLRASNRADEAKKLKERFQKWVNEVTR